MEQTADNKEKKSRREAYLERLRKKYPEKKFEDEEEIFGQISDDYDAFEQENGAMRDREKALSDMFRSDPRSAFFLNDMREGKDPVMCLVSRFGEEIRNVLDDPEMQEKIKEANQEYLERVAKSKELDAEYEKNMDETLSTLNEYQQNNNLTDEEIDNICTAWLEIIREGVMGKLTTETIALIANAINHDSDVANAKEEGEVAGRNKKIIEKMRQSEKGDGVSSLGGRSNAGMTEGRRGPKSMFDWAREA